MAILNGHEVVFSKPSFNTRNGTLEISENGEYEVETYEKVNVEVAGGGGISGGYTITFKVDGDDYYVASCQQGESVELPSKPTKDNLFFAYWEDSNGNYIEFPYTPNADIELTAVFRENNFLCDNSDIVIKIGSDDIRSIAKNNCIVGYYKGNTRTVAVIISSTQCEGYLHRISSSGMSGTQFTYNGKTYYYNADINVAISQVGDDTSGQNRYKTTSDSGYAQRILNAYFGVTN